MKRRVKPLFQQHHLFGLGEIAGLHLEEVHARCHFIGAQMDLSKDYDFSVPGYYRIGARASTPAAGSAVQSATLVSNSVSVLVGQESE